VQTGRFDRFTKFDRWRRTASLRGAPTSAAGIAVDLGRNTREAGLAPVADIQIVFSASAVAPAQNHPLKKSATSGSKVYTAPAIFIAALLSISANTGQPLTDVGNGDVHILTRNRSALLNPAKSHARSVDALDMGVRRPRRIPPVAFALHIGHKATLIIGTSQYAPQAEL
jgi:hypothetical protein